VRVLIDASYARRAPNSGSGIYIRRLVAELRTLPQVQPVPVLDARRGTPAGGGLRSARNLVHDLGWSSIALPAWARRRGAALIHHPLPAHAPRCPLPQVITVHDLAFERLPDAFAPAFRRYAHLAHRAAARRAAAVICVSEATAADVRALWGVPDARIVVAPLGPGQFDTRSVPGAGPNADAGAGPTADAGAGPTAEAGAGPTADPGSPPEDPRYFLYVGDAEPRKALGVLLEAYARYRTRAGAPLELVLAGGARAAGGAGVRVVPAPDTVSLHRLYREAAALVHPARHEGFGMTPLEAMALGTPVLAARSPAVAEVCAAAARYVEPGDAEALCEAMLALADEPAERARLRALGLRRAGAFSWARCAQAHLAAYSLALT
jgi:glycosyltransferase involved in cell wall biosynthesis